VAHFLGRPEAAERQFPLDELRDALRSSCWRFHHTRPRTGWSPGATPDANLVPASCCASDFVRLISAASPRCRSCGHRLAAVDRRDDHDDPPPRCRMCAHQLEHLIAGKRYCRTPHASPHRRLSSGPPRPSPTCSPGCRCRRIRQRRSRSGDHASAWNVTGDRHHFGPRQPELIDAAHA